ncbi:hypothetical protein [Palleronia caenipelagi]|uniref:hypothetical protein n=1 Tax=Palleronia caenipelagi TaxID=2489174 RepID=UPI001C8F3294|nr:hypothetical protein [Palleronia caenipelagi]
MRCFLAPRGVDAPEDFDWTSEGRGTALVRSVEKLIGNLPDLQQDRLKAELDHLASLSDSNGLTCAEQICAPLGIDLEGLEGVQDVLLTLAKDHPDLIDRVSAQASLMRRTGGRNWSGFQFEQDGKPWALDNESARAAFLEDTIAILELPTHRKREADWYTVIERHPITAEETEHTWATIYVEERAESELAFGATQTLERQLVQKVLEVGISCDVQSRRVEICAKGGKKIRDQYADAFAKHFAPHSNPPVETPRREVFLDRLRSPSIFETEPADEIDRIEVSSLDFFGTSGGFARFEKRGDAETIYQFLDRRFGATSPLSASGWNLMGATLRIYLAAQEGQRRRSLTVTLRTPNTTTLPNKTEKHRQFVFDLLERWELLAPPPNDDDLFEVID